MSIHRETSKKSFSYKYNQDVKAIKETCFASNNCEYRVKFYEKRPISKESL